MTPSYDLDRFVRAQASVYPRVLLELQQGEKRSHWMWFIFPQLAGLGHSWTARKFGITNSEEAIQYLQHPVLGARLVDCANLMLGVRGKSAVDILRATDAMKLRSCATLFAQVSPTDSVFHGILCKYYNGEPDDLTLDLLARATHPLEFLVVLRNL